jgi:hypothetical protein
MKTFIKAALLCVTVSGSVIAQVNRAEFNSMSWSWTNSVKWLGSKQLGPGGYGYYQDNTPSSSDVGSPNDWRKWRFVYYTGLTGTNVTAWAQWGLPSVPSPVLRPDGRLGDNCEHSHISYGVWLQYGYSSGGKYYSGVIGPLQGGSKSGVRVNNYTCRHSVNNGINWIDERFGFGNDAWSYKFPKTGNIWTAMIVGAMAVSHGQFGCSTHGCVNQPWIGAYAIGY